MNAERSTTHSARLDDEMAAETEALTRGAPVDPHTEEWRLAEPAADGEPVPESVVEFADAAGDWRDPRAASEASRRPDDSPEAPTSTSGASATRERSGIDDNERRRRSELAAALPGHAFPGDRGRLLHAAEAEHAPDWVVDALRTLPIDTRFDTPQDIWSALGGHKESRTTGAAPSADATDAADATGAAQHEAEISRPLPSPPPGIDAVARIGGIVGLGVELAAAVIGGTLNLARRVLGSLRR